MLIINNFSQYSTPLLRLNKVSEQTGYYIIIIILTLNYYIYNKIPNTIYDDEICICTSAPFVHECH